MPSATPRTRAPSLLTVVVAVLLALTTACGSDGKTLEPPPPGATAPLRPTSTTLGVSSEGGTAAPGLLALESPDFEAGGPLAEATTCLGEGRSPTLTWSGLPEGTVEVAVVMTDPDDDLFVNWVVAGLDPTSGVPAGEVPAGAVQALNSAGTPGYSPPCPAQGETHLIELTLYALSTPSGVTPDMTAEQARATLDGSTSARAVVTATATGP